MRASRLFVSTLAVLVLPLALRADMIAPPPVAERLAVTECVIVGKVTELEEKMVEAAPSPGVPRTLYKIAVVKVATEIKGGKGLTSIRVGFVPVDNPKFARRAGVNLVVGQEVLLFLNKHHEKDFQVPPMFWDVVNKEGNPAFDKDVAFLKTCTKLMEKPLEGLKSKDAEERFLAAALILSEVRRRPAPGKLREEPLDAELSKHILLALADADWSKASLRGQMSPQMMFGRLNLTPEDGWKPGPFKNYATEFPTAARKWLKDNADKYRVKKFVADK